eukprot:Lithocolla_globosa_v1_NODE_4137_length_1503_cov_7.928177.p4 type:complete len:110 gc:universal NODE_4137_length_1503_cov_7.928177:348-19(-)
MTPRDYATVAQSGVERCAQSVLWVSSVLNATKSALGVAGSKPAAGMGGVTMGSPPLVSAIVPLDGRGKHVTHVLKAMREKHAQLFLKDFLTCSPAGPLLSVLWLSLCWL